jgi:hypothetical protein
MLWRYTKMNLESPRSRILVGLLVLGVIVALCAYYAAEYENHLEHPSYRAILAEYPEGEVVRVYGTVVENYPGGYQIQQIYHDQVVSVEINGTPVAIGDRVDLLGVLGPEYSIISVEKIYVNQMWKYHFLIIRSFLVLLFMIFIFHRYWYLDSRRFLFRRR